MSWSNARPPLISESPIPLVAAVFPEAALAAADAVEPLDRLDAGDELRMLVADVALDPQPQRRAVAHRQRLAVGRKIRRDQVGRVFAQQRLAREQQALRPQRQELAEIERGAHRRRARDLVAAAKERAAGRGRAGGEQMAA